MSKYVKQCAWRWLPRRIHWHLHWWNVPRSVVEYGLPPCMVTVAQYRRMQAYVQKQIDAGVYERYGIYGTSSTKAPEES